MSSTNLSGIDVIRSYLSKIKDILEKSQCNLSEYEVFYRGESKNRDTTIPGIFRKKKDENNTLIANYWLKHEHKLFRELELRYPNVFDNAKSTMDKLSIMQHYRLPTRLLDFTTNPLLALYMAIDTDDFEEFCPTIKIVFVKKDKIKYYDSDSVSVFSNFAKMDYEKNIMVEKENILWIMEYITFEYYEKSYDSKTYERKDNTPKIEKLIGLFINDVKHKKDVKCLFKKLNGLENYTIKELASLGKELTNENLKNAFNEGVCYYIKNIHFLLHLIKDEKPYFKDMIWTEHLDKNVIFVKPKYNSQRLINQAGLFALFGLDNGKKKTFSLEELENKEHFKIEQTTLCASLEKQEDICSESFIKSLKKALGVLGVTMDRVYPEMEYSSKFIKELFS